MVGEGTRANFDSLTLDAVAVSDFNRLLALQGKEEISLPRDAYVLDVPDDRIREALTVLPGETPLQVGGVLLRCWDGPVQSAALWTTSMRNDQIWLVVPDEVARALPAFLDVFCAEYAGDSSFADALLSAKPELSNGGDPAAGSSEPLIRIAISSEITALNRMSNTAVIFIGLYIGLIFLVAGAAVLALQQLSGAVDDRPRYELLSRLGASRAQIERSLLTQMAVYFLLPLAVGAVHSVFGITFIVLSAGVLGYGDVAAGAVSAALIICLIYGLYFAASYMGARSIIRPHQNRRE